MTKEPSNAEMVLGIVQMDFDYNVDVLYWEKKSYILLCYYQNKMMKHGSFVWLKIG